MQRRLFVSTLLPLLASLSVGLWPAALAASEHKAQMDAGALFSRLLNIIDQAGIIIPGEGFGAAPEIPIKEEDKSGQLIC